MRLCYNKKTNSTSSRIYFLERATQSRGGAVDPKLVLPHSSVRHGHPPPTLTLYPGKGKGAESIQWFMEDQVFLRSYDLAPRSFSVFLCVAGRAYIDGGGRGRGRGLSRSQIIRPRESLALYKLLTLWVGVSTTSSEAKFWVILCACI